MEIEKNVCAVVVTYNRKEMLKTCIQKLKEQEGADCDILVVDNASTDGTKEYIAPLVDGERVRYQRTVSNIGGAGGFRVGMEIAVLHGYDYLWIMDDDTYVYKDSLRTLLDADEKLKGDYGFLSSIADWKDGTPCNMNRQRVSISKPISDYVADLVEIKMATFVSFFIKSSIMRKVGLPIKEFFIWADDLEFSRRISKRYTCYAVNTSHVLHNMASNHKVGIEAESRDRLWRYKLLYRNEVYIYRHEGIKGMVYMLARVILHCMRVIFSGNEKIEKLKVILNSFMKGLSFNPKVEYVEDTASQTLINVTGGGDLRVELRDKSEELILVMAVVEERRAA